MGKSFSKCISVSGMFIVTVHGKGLASRLVKSMVQAKGIPSSSFRAYLGSKAAMLQKNLS